MNWAVIRSGGKQYKVAEGQTISVEKIGKNEGEKINFSEVLLASTDGKVTVGKPTIEKTKVTGQIIGDYKDKKIRVVKFKSKSRYTRTTGHRQTKTQVKIEKIES